MGLKMIPFFKETIFITICIKYVIGIIAAVQIRSNIKRVTSRLISLRVCLDGEIISVRIALFGLVVDNSVRLVISREM
jgi:hypothetical protein